MEKQYETPENNVKLAALRLMRFKALREIGKVYKTDEWVLRLQDVNEILTVAGLPVIVPEELKTPEIDVIKVNREDEA